MRFLKKSIILFLIPLVSLIIISSWFSEGKIISNTSEEILSIFHSQKTAEHNSTFWYPGGTGYKTPFSVSSYPVLAGLGWLEKIGVPPFARQAVLLFTLMLVGVSSVYLLVRKGLNLENPVAIIGSLFYLLNIYSMTQIWKRFIYTHITAWAYLPLFIFLWIKWVNTRRPLWLIIFLSSSLLFTNSFSNPVFILTIWAPAFIFVIERLWSERKKGNQVAYTIIISLVGLIFWSLVNIWWLYPTLTLGSSWTAQTGQTTQGDFESLRAVSQSFPIQEILLLRQSWFLGSSNDWNDFYHNPFIILLNIGVFLMVIYGVIRSKGYRFRGFLLSLGFIGLFISKGTNFPFGYTFFHILFSKLPLSTALRNSYEKFGLVWLLPYAIFFAIGFYSFVCKFKRQTQFLLGGLIISLFCGLLVYPMWNGDIFPPKHRLNVPAYYIEANNYLDGRNSQIIFNIPFLLEQELRTYSWGYIGEDPSQNLFNAVPIAKPVASYYYRFYKIFPELLYNNQFPKVLGLLGVSDVVVNKDSIYPKINLSETFNYLDKWEEINSEREFGELRIYSLDQKLIKSRVYTVSDIIISETPKESLEKVLNGSINTDNSVFVLQKEKPSNIPNSFIKPKIAFQKINAADYLVQISESKGSFILILNESFDISWKAKIDNKLLGNHFIANGFANGWIINEKGDFQIELKLAVWPWD